MAWEKSDVTPQPIGKPIIALCLSQTGNINTEFAESVWGPLRWTPLDWCVKIPFQDRSPSLPLSRNILVRLALEAGATHLLWVDADGALEKPKDVNEALRLLLNCNYPIASCLYRAKQKVGFNYAAWVKAGEKAYTPIESWTGNWFTVDVTGLHFCLIKREVFEKVPAPWFHWENEGEVSEDFFFFEKARQAGYEVKIFTEVRLSHLGTLKVQTDGKVTTPDA